jgi:hypothetical protein
MLATQVIYCRILDLFDNSSSALKEKIICISLMMKKLETSYRRVYERNMIVICHMHRILAVQKIEIYKINPPKENCLCGLATASNSDVLKGKRC